MHRREPDRKAAGTSANITAIVEITTSGSEKCKSMFHSCIRHLCIVVLGFLAVSFASVASAQANQNSLREVVADVKDTRGRVDRFFDLSIGSDYPGTLIRDDSQAQLKLVTAELGFRYIRFHAIFHDVLGTVRVENGATVYDWAKIDQLYDDLLARHIRPFVELGFTPKALATSQNSIFYWHGNTSHPKRDGWRDLVDAFVRHEEKRYGKDEVRTWYFEVWNEPNLSGFWEGGDQKAYFELYDLTARKSKLSIPSCGSAALVRLVQHGSLNFWRMSSSAALHSISLRRILTASRADF
jgi:xylan 1,4-beta-xylosidase